MHVSATTIFRIVFVITLSALTAAPVAQAQVDHLQCHKVKDGQKFKGTIVDLTAIQAEFQLPDSCDLKPKAKQFCVPVTKTVLEPGTAPGSAIGPGQDLSANDYLCYKVKCPKTEPADTLVTDQFGERTLEKIKAPKILCVPAVKGVVTTTTTTTLPPSGDICCQGSGVCLAGTLTPTTCTGAGGTPQPADICAADGTCGGAGTGGCCSLASAPDAVCAAGPAVDQTFCDDNFGVFTQNAVCLEDGTCGSAPPTTTTTTVPPPSDICCQLQGANCISGAIDSTTCINLSGTPEPAAVCGADGMCGGTGTGGCCHLGSAGNDVCLGGPSIDQATCDLNTGTFTAVAVCQADGTCVAP